MSVRRRKKARMLVGLTICVVVVSALLFSAISYRRERALRFAQIKEELERRLGTELDVNHDSVPRLFAEVLVPGMSREEVHALIFGYDSMRSGETLGKYDRYFEEYLFIQDFQKFLYVTYDAEWRLVRAEVL